MADDKKGAKAAEQETPEVTQETGTQGFDLAALKAELKAEIYAEMKAEAKVSEKEEAAPASSIDPWLEEYVQVQLFKDGKDYKDDVFVSVNGENCVIKRGYPVKVKRKFALVLEQSQQQDVRAAEYAEAKQKEFDQQVKYFNL